MALAYEWGSANHMAPRDSSPGDRANLDTAILMKAFGGQFKKEKPYPSELCICLYACMYVCICRHVYICKLPIIRLPVYVYIEYVVVVVVVVVVIVPVDLVELLVAVVVVVVVVV